MSDLEDDDPNALEAKPGSPRVRPGGHLPRAREDHTPKPLLVIDPKNLLYAALTIRAAVLERQRREGAGSYLYVDTERQAYVVSEQRNVAALWIKEKFGWLVAFYAPRRKDGSKKNDDGSDYLAATITGITEDLQQHLDDLERPQP